MTMIERETEQNKAEYKALVSSLFDEISEQSQFGIISSGEFFPGEAGRPTFRSEFDVVKQEAIFEIESRDPASEELRRYILKYNSIKKGGYVSNKDGVTHYTDEKQEYLDRGIEEDEVLTDTLRVSFSELDTLAKLVFSPHENADLVESLPRLLF